MGADHPENGVPIPCRSTRRLLKREEPRWSTRSSGADAVVVPFGRGEDGNIVPLEPIEARDSVGARNCARDAAAKHGGAIAFSRTGDPDSGEFSDAVILAKISEVDEGMLGA